MACTRELEIAELIGRLRDLDERAAEKAYDIIKGLLLINARQREENKNGQADVR